VEYETQEENCHQRSIQVESAPQCGWCSKQKPGVHFNETYTPVVAWPTTRFFLIQALINKWKTKQLDFVLAYPQAPVERELYMEIPKRGKDREAE
jgi:hypothetical protein